MLPVLFYFLMTTSLEDYLESILLLCEEEGAARVSAIAARMNVTKPSVNRALVELKRLSYVDQQPYGAVALTEAGERAAREILQRHRLLKSFLLLLGVPDVRAEEDACKMEHLLSLETLRCIERYCVRIRAGAERDGE